jgi:hypothetical protein
MMYWRGKLVAGGDFVPAPSTLSQAFAPTKDWQEQSIDEGEICEAYLVCNLGLLALCSGFLHCAKVH